MVIFKVWMREGKREQREDKMNFIGSDRDTQRERERGRERESKFQLGEKESQVCPEEKPCPASWSVHESIPGVRMEWDACPMLSSAFICTHTFISSIHVMCCVLWYQLCRPNRVSKYGWLQWSVSNVCIAMLL